jgi:hypothetical protein
MSPLAGFYTFLGVTVAALAAVVYTGTTAQRRAHLLAVVATAAGLAAAIFYALELGELYDLEAAGVITPIHLTLAKITTAAYLLPIVTGVLTWRDARWRRLHARLAWTIVALTVVTTVTGALMLMGAEPLAQPLTLPE